MTWVTADRNKKARRFFSTKDKWPTRKEADFEFTVPKRQYHQQDVRIPKDIVNRLKHKYDDTIWVIDSIDNCFQFILKKDGDKHFIRAVDLGKVKKVYKIQIIFTMRLSYIGWGLFYGIVRDEHGHEVQPIRVENLYVKNILPKQIIGSVKKHLKLSYLHDSEVEEPQSSSSCKTSNECQQTSIQTDKSKYMNVESSPNRNQKREDEIFTFKKTMKTTDMNTKRLYVPALFS
ncbi:hypothetical protein PIB30_054072 [Stylosanthes scabra]|uniref:Uncharacterized protein n=1 Tax=Stylosanthes scabra TaxID=79078 RepID=A0ABU6WGV6_9FABA|nr:hypothetical protein [Stylosanthes scabra]